MGWGGWGGRNMVARIVQTGLKKPQAEAPIVRATSQVNGRAWHSEAIAYHWVDDEAVWPQQALSNGRTRPAYQASTCTSSRFATWVHMCHVGWLL